MEKIKLTFVKATSRTSAGGKPYTSLSIKCEQYGDKYLSGFGNKDNAMWKVGDTVEITVKKVEKDGKEYLNFETPKKEDKQDEKLEQILNKLTALTLEVRRLNEKLTTPEQKRAEQDAENGYHYPTPEEEGIDLDQIPF